MITYTGKLYLIPTVLAENTEKNVISPQIKSIVDSLDIYLVENIRTARRYLIKLGINKSIDSLTFLEINKQTKAEDIPALLAPLEKNNAGLLSEAGMPAIADPGAQIVHLAHAYNVQVIPLTGPSSIFLALAASGLNGQHFEFHGYLPVKAHERSQKIKQLEMASIKTGATQIFIETPYRNNQMVEELVKTCKPSTFLCIATDITSLQENIKTKQIGEWKKQIPKIAYLIFSHMEQLYIIYQCGVWGNNHIIV